MCSGDGAVFLVRLSPPGPPRWQRVCEFHRAATLPIGIITFVLSTATILFCLGFYVDTPHRTELYALSVGREFYTDNEEAV